MADPGNKEYASHILRAAQKHMEANSLSMSKEELRFLRDCAGRDPVREAQFDILLDQENEQLKELIEQTDTAKEQMELLQAQIGEINQKLDSTALATAKESKFNHRIQTAVLIVALLTLVATIIGIITSLH